MKRGKVLPNSVLFSPKSSVSLKKFLLDLNRDLDAIKRELKHNWDYGFYYHSIYPTSGTLSDVERAILFMEDRRFFLHHGVDWRAVPRAIKRLIFRWRLGGVSTIDQQVVRIVTLRRERTISRKFREILLARVLNFHVSKRMMLDYYVHYAYLGHGIEGCEMAALIIFGKKASQLTWEEGAFVAALLPLPMPRSVVEMTYRFGGGSGYATPEEIIEASNDLAPRWAGRVKYRYNLALRGQDFIPSSR